MSADQTNTAEAVERVHELKTWPEYFAAVVAGTKPFEIRNNDRGFRRGDKLILREWNPDNGQYTGARHEATVTYVTSFGQIPGHVVLGLSSPELDRLRSRIMELEKALGPFASMGRWLESEDSDARVVQFYGVHGRSPVLTREHFGAAARVLPRGGSRMANIFTDPRDEEGMPAMPAGVSRPFALKTADEIEAERKNTPAPIATPEEVGKRIALSGASIMLPFDLEGEGNPIGVQFPSRKKLAAQIAEAIAAALSTSAAAIERVTRERDAAQERGSKMMWQVQAAEARVATLTAEVGRMREALEKALPVLDENYRWHRDVQSTAGRVLSAHAALEAARAALSPTEPDAMEK